MAPMTIKHTVTEVQLSVNISICYLNWFDTLLLFHPGSISDWCKYILKCFAFFLRGVKSWQRSLTPDATYIDAWSGVLTP